MTFNWDVRKSAENVVRRGFDFAFASLVFTDTYVEYDDTRRDYGERRVIALGFADGIAVENGYVRLPEVPGVGFEEKANLIALMRTVAA